ncbi:hypothetical protein CsatA_028545 [Cannabis sativa]
MFPPGANILPGKPKKKRRRDADEPPPPNCTKTRRTGAIMHCSKCKKPGHSKRTCKNDAAPAPTPPTQGQKNKGGRPPIQNPNKETLKRRKRREMEKARKARQAAEGGGPGSAEAGGSNT